MFLIDVTRPIAFQQLSQRFRFADALERVTGGVADQLMDSFDQFLVGGEPVLIVLPSLLSKENLYSASASLRFRPLPASSDCMASCKRRAGAGDRKRYAVSSRAS